VWLAGIPRSVSAVVADHTVSPSGRVLLFAGVGQNSPVVVGTSEHPRLGSIIRDWNEHRIVRPRVKLAAAAAIVLLTATVLIFGNFSPVLKTASIIVSLAVVGMICRQPSR
jgi:hypothetical protein